MKKIKTWDEIKKGQKFKVVSNSHSHNYPLDTTLTFNLNTSHLKSAGSLSNIAKEFVGNSINPIDIALVNETMEELESQLKALKENYESSMKEINNKIDFMKETGSSEYDEEEYKIYNILKELKNNNSDLERTKAIKKILDKF